MNYQELKQFRSASNLRGASAIKVQLWWIVQSTFFGCSPQFVYGWRRFLLRLFGAKVGKGVIIRPTARITYPWKLELGDHCWVGDEVVLYNWGKITIGKNAVVSQRSYLCTASHDMNDSTFPLTAQPITVEEQSWLATDVFVSPGVTIGKGSVVGARSTVFKDVPPGKICAGYPAKVIRDR